jgi:hypothetical protein
VSLKTARRPGCKRLRARERRLRERFSASSWSFSSMRASMTKRPC